MAQRLTIPILLVLLGAALAASGTTLREAFEAAGPGGGFDKLVVLETGRIYTGPLHIGPTLPCYSSVLVGDEGLDVRIAGNGALLDLEGGQLCMSYCNNRLEVEDCVVLNGNIRYRGLTWEHDVYLPDGLVRHVTFYDPHDFGIRFQRTGPGIRTERNMVVNAVDTGYDFIYITGIASEWLPTGSSFAPGVAISLPEMVENWSWHEDPGTNADPIRHFMLLCDYG